MDKNSFIVTDCYTNFVGMKFIVIIVVIVEFIVNMFEYLRIIFRKVFFQFINSVELDLQSNVFNFLGSFYFCYTVTYNF